MRSQLGLAALLLAMLPLDAPAQAIMEADGAAELGVALRRLGTTKRVLMVAAHPDDENTALLAELALGDGADVAYLSLTRGEGGQNLIGPELQEGLGLIRSEELLAARRLDGARQYFTRAYDYGFSKSADEAFTQWPRDSLLADVVEVVRRYRPDIIVSVFSGTPADGHGQHQAAGILAREAFVAAGDAARFPGQVARGLAPHSAKYLFQAMYRPPADPPLRYSTGAYDPLFGRSRYQIAMQSRSRHRSQDMGMAQPLGPQHTALRVLDGDFPSGAQSLFAALDTTLTQHARTAGVRDDVLDQLETYEVEIARLVASYNPLQTGLLREPLARAVRALDSAAALLGPAHHDLAARVHVERAQAADALMLAASVLMDVVADTPAPVAGTSFELALTIWNGGNSNIGVTSARPILPSGWSYEGGDDLSGTLAPDEVVRHAWRVTVPDFAEPTEPYFLRTARHGAMYSWEGVADSVRSLPFGPADVAVAVTLDAGAEVHVRRPAEYAVVDKAIGELRRPLIVVPAVAITVEPHVAAIPAGHTAPRQIAVTVSAARDDVRGVVRLAAPAGWSVAPAAVDLAFGTAGESRTVDFAVTPPADAAGEHVLHATFESGGRVYDEGYSLIDYPHVRPHPLYRQAAVRAVVLPVAVAEDLRVGYIEGAGDDGANALRQMGAAVEMIDPAAIANADLSVYDAIVAGIRAYEVRPDLVTYNARLVEYVRSGGTFIVQYNKYELVDGGFMPYPATMSRPHGRVTDENAAVTLIAPEHPLLSWPNRITTRDFDGWAQERGLYFLETFDSRYDALLSMADPGEPPQTGSLVVAPVGDGWYVYTGLALFRQLPQAVPGAYRLLANLVSFGRAPP